MQSLFLCSILCFVFITCFFSFFVFVLFLKNRIFRFDILSFDLFVFSSIVVRFESGLQKNILSSFNLVLV